MRWKFAATLLAVVAAVLTSPFPAMASDPGPVVARSISAIVGGAPVGAAIGRTTMTSLVVAHPTSSSTAAVRKRPSVWRRVIADNFNSNVVPGHWGRYDGPYGSGPHNCASPANVYASGGSLHLVMRYRSSGRCGAGWYTGGVMIGPKYGAVDQRITIRFRVVRHGAASHFIIPMRWPTTTSWPKGGEEDYCETDTLRNCYSFLHYGSSNKQVYKAHAYNLAAWHTIRVQRYSHVVKVFVDNMTRPVWVYRGSSATLPDTFKRVVLQQECQSSCPSGTSGTEDIQIAWLTIDDRR